MTEPHFDAAPVLRGLKDFQRRTVEHAFKRLYKDKNPSRRFLVADEVGLGKTLVARGIVAKAIEHLQYSPEIDRIDVVYVCSNAAIAQQNVNRLNVLGLPACALATRLTLLPLELSNLGEQRINFVSFTPGTTFDLKSSTGRREERQLLYHVLRQLPHLDKRGLVNLLRCDVRADRWRAMLQEPLHYDESIIRDFLSAVIRDRELTVEFGELCNQFRQEVAGPPTALRKRRNVLVGRLRRLLAKGCVEALEPDLIILDEFQRFKDLLREDTEAGELAHDLIDYPDARLLMLSATPYRMLSLYDEEAEDHYQDFIETLRFLFNDEASIRRTERDLALYRHALYEPGSEAEEIRDRLRYRLMRVMSRTERIGHTRERDAMIIEPVVHGSLEPVDLQRAAALDGVVRAVGAKEALEYWKSAPYLLNFMKGYELKEKVDGTHRENGVVADALATMQPHMVQRAAVSRYEVIDPGNARLRALVDYTLGRDEWRLIWMPPSLPYTRPGPLFEGVDPITKSIVFSSWNVVPDVIAAVCSYTVERQRVLRSGLTDYFELSQTRKALLTFKLGEGRPESMSALTLMYPSPYLARTIDPLREALDRSSHLMTPDELRHRAVEKLGPAFNRLPRGERRDQGREDPAWYWFAMARVGRASDGTIRWCRTRNGWRGAVAEEHGEADGAFARHVEHFCEAFDRGFALGTKPPDVTETVAEIALGSPAVCAARALNRIAPDLGFDDPALLSAAAIIADGFRSLFNSPDVRSFLEIDDTPYWRQVLRYCIDGNLQSVLDEYVHMLRESLGLSDKPGNETVTEIAHTIHGVLSIRTSSLVVDDFKVREGEGFEIESFKMRCKYALRFGDMKDDSAQVLHRAGVVRDAFNSPFRPFILASTSIGQEGLDFHSYCHRVWHWNLPRNPVDMEQREGRVNRFKGHAVRKNVARAIGLEGLAEISRMRDPWQGLFNTARRRLRDEGKHRSDLQPYWIYEGIEDPFRVERLIPLPPFSAEQGRLKMLKRNLAVYRLAFGQPRQQDLMDYLTSEGVDAKPERLGELRLDLAPK